MELGGGREETSGAFVLRILPPPGDINVTRAREFWGLSRVRFGLPFRAGSGQGHVSGLFCRHPLECRPCVGHFRSEESGPCVGRFRAGCCRICLHWPLNCEVPVTRCGASGAAHRAHAGARLHLSAGTSPSMRSAPPFSFFKPTRHVACSTQLRVTRGRVRRLCFPSLARAVHLVPTAVPSCRLRGRRSVTP